MKNRVALGGLLALSVAAGAWLFMPAPQTESVRSCDEGGACTAPEVAAPDESAAEDSQQTSAPEQPVAVDRTAQAPAAPAAAAPPADGIALRKQADELRAAGRIPEAIVALKAATRADPSARNHGDLGEMLASVLAMDEALVHLRKAADLDPGNADRWITLANAYYRKMDPGKAWAAEKRAKQADPGLELGFDAGGRRVRKPAAAGDSPAQRQ